MCLSPRVCAHTGCCLGDAPALLGKLVPAMEKAAVTNTLISDVLMRKKGFLFVNNSYFSMSAFPKRRGDLVLRAGPQRNPLVIQSPDPKYLPVTAPFKTCQAACNVPCAPLTAYDAYF